MLNFINMVNKKSSKSQHLLLNVISWSSFIYRVPGNVLLSHVATLSSAMKRFTLLFEMGRGGTISLSSPSIFFQFGMIFINYSNNRVKPVEPLVLVSLMHYC